jgi:hypothetical protein
MLRISTRGLTLIQFQSLKKALSQLFESDTQFDFENTSNLDSEIHFELDFKKKTKYLPGKFNVLILWEPKSVSPWQYKTNCLREFDLVVPISPWRAENLNLENWIFHPINIDVRDNMNVIKSRTVVMINSSKFSANRLSLYGFRRQVSKELNQSPIDYDLFGGNWHMSKRKEFRERLWALRKEFQTNNQPSLTEAFSYFFYRFPEYRGIVEDKVQTISNYKYALVIENEADFISEKVFDVIFAKTVPIYVGPDLNRFQPIAQCVIQCKPDVGEILKVLSEDNQDIYLQKKIAIDKINSDQLQEFTLDYNFRKLAEITKKVYLDR